MQRRKLHEGSRSVGYLMKATLCERYARARAALQRQRSESKWIAERYACGQPFKFYAQRASVAATFAT